MIDHLEMITGVSIRPRLWGRGKHEPEKNYSTWVRFQSAPGFGAGGNAEIARSKFAINSFQSAPGFGAGGNRGREAVKGGMTCFNPPPALGPGETEPL